MKINLRIVSILIKLLALPLLMAGQGVMIPSGAYMVLSGGTLVLRGNWVNNGVYTDQSGSIIINDSTHISGSSLNTFTDVTVLTGSLLSIDPQNSVTVNGLLTNNAGTPGFVLQSDATGTASLLHNTYNVPATVQRYIPGAAEAWHFLSSPVSAQAISGSWLPSGTYGNGTGYDLYAWNEPTNCWIYKLNTTSVVNWNTVNPGNDFAEGRGYLYSVQATNPTKEFTGNLNNGSLDYGITAGSTDALLKGFNLVGNPYPSAMDWQAASGWSRSDLVNSGGGYDMWVWNPAADNYGVFNSATGNGTNSVTRYIASAQGFFVRASSGGLLGMDNNVRVHQGAGNWFKNAEINTGMVSIAVKSETDNSFDEALLMFGYTANEPGATKLFSHVLSAPGIYIPSGGENYSVRYLTDTVDNPAVPVMFKPGIDGSYTIKCNFNTDDFKIITLEDRQMQYIQNLKAKDSYTFIASKTDDANRFVLHFGADLNPSGNELPARIYTDGTRLIVDLTLVGGETEAFVYDAIGRIVLQKSLTGLTQHDLNINTSTQILLVQLRNRQGNLFRKLFYKN